MDKFSIEANGYSKAEVNKFLDDVITQTEAIINRVKSQNREIKDLKHQLEIYKNIEQEMKESMSKLETQGTDIRKRAMEDSKMILDEAKKNASRIVNDALIRSEKIELKAETLERNVRIFKNKLRLIVEQQLSVVEEIEELKID